MTAFSAFNCAFRDRIVAAALRGDADAVRLMVAALPPDMPPAVVTAHRDTQIRRLGWWLSETIPGSSTNLRATILAAAGQAVQTGRGLSDRRPFAVLSAGERTELEATVRDLLSLSPKWPRVRRCREILD